MVRALCTLLICSFFYHSGFSQNLSYSCPKDSIIGCNNACITLKSTIPDIKSSSAEYTLQNISTSFGCRPYISPDTPGPSANLLIDDTYTQAIPITFSFPFYGIPYNSLLISTNGYVSFDISKANTGSHYELLNNSGTLSATLGSGENLPSSLYDPAVIMGAYHDLNPAYTTSPTQQIKYNIVGTAPNRKWIVSFYKLPLFNTPVCNLLIENTQQIILHESTGIIEVFIRDKQICTSWNDGRSIIGLQNMSKNKGIMPPGRRASDLPWGSIGMNETWRFIPSQGPTLYRSVQLLDATGTAVATGDTTRLNTNTFEVSFPNICPPIGTSFYVIKTTYQKINDPSPGATIFSLDTVNIIRQTSLPLSTSTTATTCGLSTGTITVSANGGTGPYQYGIDGGALQLGNTFTGLTVGNHTVFAQDALGCNNTISVIVPSINSLTATSSVTNTSCPTVNNGSITVTPTSGTAPFQFSLNGGAAQSNATFTALASGTYTLSFVDINNCSGSITVTVGSGAALTSTSNTFGVSCTTASNGSTTIIPTSGIGPYTFSIDAGPLQSSGTFTGLTAGTHTVTFFDQSGCSGTKSIFVTTGTGFSTTVSQTNTSCAGVNDGTITVTATTGTPPFIYTLDGGPPQPTGFFTAVGSGTHIVVVKDATNCSRNRTFFITSGVALIATVSSTGTTCATISNGTITITPNNGTAPFIYSLDGGSYQNQNTFSSVSAGTHAISFKDANGCVGTSSVIVSQGSTLNASYQTVNPTCANTSSGSITILTSSGFPPFQYSMNAGVTFQSNRTFNSIPQGVYSIVVRDSLGCVINKSITLTDPPVLIASAVNSTASDCYGNNGTVTVTATGGTSPYVYSIDNGFTFNNNPVFTSPSIGTLSSIQVKDSQGCLATTSVLVALLDNMYLNIGNDTTICAEKSILMNPIASAGTTIYKWRPLDTSQTSIQTITNDTIRQPIITPTDTAQYILFASWGLCSREDTIQLNILHKPIPNAGKDTAICNHTSAILRGAATDLSGTVNYLWLPSYGILNPDAAITQTTPDSTTFYTLTVTDNYGCNFSVSDQVKVTVQPPVPAFAGNDSIAVKSVPHQLFGSGGISYLWSPSAPLNIASTQNPLVILLQDQLFILKVTDIAGCIGYDTVFIKVYEGPNYYIPNAFSPNADGNNDIFRPIPVGITKTDWFRVFNRYGQLIFETSEWLKGWDGSFKGKQVESGVYVWLIKGSDRNGHVIEMKGTVTLIR